MLFTNHSCAPNIGVQGQIVFVALRDIAAGEELTHDWATTDDDTYEMRCRCGAAPAAARSPARTGGRRTCRRGTAATCPGT